MSLTPREKLQARKALMMGRINRAEYDHLLGTEHLDRQPDRTRAYLSIVLSTAVIALMSLLFLFTEGGITGFVTAEWNTTTYSENTLVDLEVSGITGVKVSGVLESGGVTINAIADNTTYLVYAETLPERRIWTNKTQYAVNETIDLFVDMENYTLWLDDGNKTPVTEPLMINETGIYTIEALGNEKLSITIEVVANASDSVRTDAIAFTNACASSCAMLPSNSSVQLEVLTNGRVSITDVQLIGQNTAPVQIQDLPDVVLDGEYALNLSEYFADAEGDELVYEMNNLIGLIESIDGEILSLEGTVPGTYAGTIYVGDGQAITTAEFTITVPGEVTEQLEPANNTSDVSNNTTVKIPPGQNKPADCSHPNINKRPPECFGDSFDLAFKEVTAPLNDQNQNKVGRVTRLGNLIIRGEVIENSNDSPGRGDWSVGYTQSTDVSNEYVPTAWIDSSSGDLYLRGRLYQEILGLTAPSQNTFIISNSNGMVLGYFDRSTGDLFLRGNLVQGTEP